jgi:hypothetical protein
VNLFLRIRDIKKVSKKENKKIGAFIQHKEKKGEKGDRKYKREDRKNK